MACASLGISAPTLPAIFLPSGIAINLEFGEVGVTCCHYTIPGVRVAIPIPIDPATLAVAAAVVNAAIATALATLRTVQIPDCPTE